MWTSTLIWDFALAGSRSISNVSMFFSSGPGLAHVPLYPFALPVCRLLLHEFQ